MRADSISIARPAPGRSLCCHVVAAMHLSHRQALPMRPVHGHASAVPLCHERASSAHVAHGRSPLLAPLVWTRYMCERGPSVAGGTIEACSCAGRTNKVCPCARCTVVATWWHGDCSGAERALEMESVHEWNGGGRVSAAGMAVVPFLAIRRVNGYFVHNDANNTI